MKKNLDPGPGEIVVHRGSGTDAKPFVVGRPTFARWDSRLAPDFTTVQMRDEGTSHRVGVVVPLEVHRDFYEEDGLSFGVGDDRGWLYSARVRPATEEEHAALRDAAQDRADARVRSRRRRELDGRVLGAFTTANTLRPDGEADDAPHPGAAAVPWEKQENLGADYKLHVHEGQGLVWMSWPASGRWVDAGCYRQPLTPERQALIEDLRAEYGHVTELKG